MDNKELCGAQDDDSEDDLDVEVARGALHAGLTAFQGGQWDEASNMLEEALEASEQLPPAQRRFCDCFAVQHKLAICSYHIAEPADTEKALSNLSQQSPSSAEHKQLVYDASHHLPLLYVRLGRIEDAKAECEKALQGRRKLPSLGKTSEVALQSTALMAHIYGMAGKRARSQALLGMIPEERKSIIVGVVEAALGATLGQSDRASIAAPSISDTSSQPRYSMHAESGAVTPMVHANSTDHRPPPIEVQAPVATAVARQNALKAGVVEAFSPVAVTRSFTAGSLAEEQSVIHLLDGDNASMHRSPSTLANREPQVLSSNDTAKRTKGLTRMEVLRNIHFMPSDRIEELVVSGDYGALTLLLNKKRTGSWRSKVQKALHSKRVTALHYAALFGEIESARALLEAGYNINEVPESSTTRQTPLKFAIGARQVDMVAFLTIRGARPVAPDSWATLAGLLLDRLRLSNTLSKDDREDLEDVPRRIILILRMWLRKGWDPDTPYTPLGKTLLHQTVAFESGFYQWDANLRGTVARFLCNEGADPTLKDNKDNSPYSMASVVEDQDLLLVFDQRLRTKELEQSLSDVAKLQINAIADAVELPVGLQDPVELPAK